MCACMSVRVCMCRGYERRGVYNQRLGITQLVEHQTGDVGVWV